MTLHQPQARSAFSRGSCPRITGPWQWWAAPAPGRGGMESDLCSHTGFLVAAAAALASHACLWGPRWSLRLAPISGVHFGGALNPLSLRAAKQRGKKKSLASSTAADFFQVSLPASCGVLTPSGCVHSANPSPFPAIRPKPSLSSQPRPPRRVSRQASQAAECCSAPSLCAGVSPLCPPHPCVCALLRGSEASPLCHPQSLPAKGLLVRGNLSSFTAPSHWCRSRPYSFVSVISFFFCPTQVCGEFLAFWEV